MTEPKLATLPQKPNSGAGAGGKGGGDSPADTWEDGVAPPESTATSPRSRGLIRTERGAEHRVRVGGWRREREPSAEGSPHSRPSLVRRLAEGQQPPRSWMV